MSTTSDPETRASEQDHIHCTTTTAAGAATTSDDQAVEMKTNEEQASRPEIILPSADDRDRGEKVSPKVDNITGQEIPVPPSSDEGENSEKENPKAENSTYLEIPVTNDVKDDKLNEPPAVVEVEKVDQAATLDVITVQKGVEICAPEQEASSSSESTIEALEKQPEDKPTVEAAKDVAEERPTIEAAENEAEQKPVLEANKNGLEERLSVEAVPEEKQAVEEVENETQEQLAPKAVEPEQKPALVSIETKLKERPASAAVENEPDEKAAMEGIIQETEDKPALGYIETKLEEKPASVAVENEPDQKAAMEGIIKETEEKPAPAAVGIELKAMPALEAVENEPKEQTAIKSVEKQLEEKQGVETVEPSSLTEVVNQLAGSTSDIVNQPAHSTTDAVNKPANHSECFPVEDPKPEMVKEHEELMEAEYKTSEKPNVFEVVDEEQWQDIKELGDKIDTRPTEDLEGGVPKDEGTEADECQGNISFKEDKISRGQEPASIENCASANKQAQDDLKEAGNDSITPDVEKATADDIKSEARVIGAVEELLKDDTKPEEKKEEKNVKNEQELEEKNAKTEQLAQDQKVNIKDVNDSDIIAEVADKLLEVEQGSRDLEMVKEKEENMEEAIPTSNETKKDTEVNETSATSTTNESEGETKASQLEPKVEETVETNATDLESAKEDIKRTSNPPVLDSSKDGDDTKASKGLPSQEVSVKSSQKPSGNIISKVKHSLVKVKKAITGKSPSTRTLSAEVKGDEKVK